MSTTDYEIITGILLCICLAAIYFYWMKYELKEQFSVELKATVEKLKAANQTCADELQFSQPSKLLRQANDWMRQINQFCEEVDLEQNIDDLVAVRRQLYFVNRYIDLALAPRRKNNLFFCLLA